MKRQAQTEKVDFSYYQAINKQQEEFHNSTANHKLLIGGYGSGKTYPLIHEALFTAYDNPGHNIAIFRNTWDSLRENIEREFLEVAEEAKAIKKWIKHQDDLVLNCDTIVRFRPLSLSRAQLKGLNICWFGIDDPDVDRFKEVISFLFTRLRNSPKAQAKYFGSAISANYEGHNWLWQTYMRDRPQGGNGKFAYWICPTTSNPTLPDDFVDNLASIHSESWMKRFVYCDIDQSYTGLIYDEFNPKVHFRDLSWCEKDDSLIKIMAIDVGVTDPTVVLKIATDYHNVYFYDEWYYPNVRTNTLGEYVRRELKKEKFKKILIDPSASKRDQNSNRSVRDDLRSEFAISTEPADNNILYGIEVVKTLMTETNGVTHWFCDPRKCRNLVREKEIWRWKEPEMSDFDELAFKEKPIDKDNHALDAERYGTVYLKRYLRGLFNKEKEIAERRKKLFEDRYNKLSIYRKHRSRRELESVERLIDIHYNKGQRHGKSKRLKRRNVRHIHEMARAERNRP